MKNKKEDMYKATFPIGLYDGDMSNIGFAAVVDSLPEEGKSNIIYIVVDNYIDKNKHRHVKYDEFIWDNSRNVFEILGRTDKDLDEGYFESIKGKGFHEISEEEYFKRRMKLTWG